MKVTGKRIIKSNSEQGDITENGALGYEVLKMLEQDEEDVIVDGISHMGLIIYDNDPDTCIATVNTKYEYLEEEDKELELEGTSLETFKLAEELNDDFKKDYAKFKEEQLENS